MINKKFWEKIAEEWKKPDDGIIIPKPDTGGVSDIDPDAVSFGSTTDAEINDILSDLGLDDI